LKGKALLQVSGQIVDGTETISNPVNFLEARFWTTSEFPTIQQLGWFLKAKSVFSLTAANAICARVLRL
jgi:hypothetical protein